MPFISLIIGRDLNGGRRGAFLISGRGVNGGRRGAFPPYIGVFRERFFTVDIFLILQVFFGAKRCFSR